MASGKDVSDMFPGVVKNVVSKNIEVVNIFYVTAHVVILFIVIRSKKVPANLSALILPIFSQITFFLGINKWDWSNGANSSID